MNAMTEQTYRPIILSKYTAVLKSCRNLISSEDIRLIRKAFKIAIQNETEASELNYQEIVRILDITLIITQEIGLGRTSIICAMLHKTVEKEMITLEQIREMFGEANHQRTEGYQPHLCHPADCKLGEFQKIIAQFCRRYPRTADLPGRKTLCFTAGCAAFGGRTKTAGHGNQLYLHPFCPSIGIVQYQIGDGRHSSPLCQSPNLPGDRTKIKGIENRPNLSLRLPKK